MGARLPFGTFGDTSNSAQNFFIPDFISELESYIFTWTITYSDHQSSWKKGLLRERGLDYYGVELKKPTENCLDLSEMSAKDLETDDLDALANHLSAAMKNDSMPMELFNVMADALSIVPKDWRTPETILMNLQELRKAEAKND